MHALRERFAKREHASCAVPISEDMAVPIFSSETGSVRAMNLIIVLLAKSQNLSTQIMLIKTGWIEKTSKKLSS